MPNPEFWYEECASGLIRLCGPGVVIALDRLSGFGHSLSASRALSKEREYGDGDSVFRVYSASDGGRGPLDPMRVFNPVYQELVRHDVTGNPGRGLCVLLTGSFHEHHFSAVLRLDRDPASPRGIVFDVDVADRCRAPVAKLAATYDVDYPGAGPTMAGGGPSTVRWQIRPADDHGLLELVAEPPAVIGVPKPLSSAHCTQVEVAAAIDPKTHTQRLRYRWRWTS